MDAETKQILTDADEIKATLSGRGWSIIKSKLDMLILDLQNIHNIEGTTSDDMMMSLKARAMASKLLFDWLKNDVYGTVEQAEANRIPESNPSSDFMLVKR